MPRLDRTDLGLIGLALAIKAALLIGGVVAVTVATGSVPGVLEPWDRWDGPHYTDLAVFGYRAVDDGTLVREADGYRSVYPGDLPLYIVFYPLFPWLTAAVDAVLRDPLIAAFVVSGLASFFVAPLLRRLVAVDLGERVGRRAAVFLLLFPSAYFLHIGYTESLFLALALGAFLSARTDRWWLAGGLAGLATLTRVNGLLLVPAFAAEALARWWPERTWRWRWLAGPAGVAIGFGGYLALNVAVFGDPFTFAEFQRTHWHKSLSPPWGGLGHLVGFIGSANPEQALMLGWVELAFVALGLAATIASALRFRPSWTAWSAGNLLLFVSTSFVLSVPRYTLVVFPLMAWLAVLGERRWLGWGLGLVSAALMGYFAWRFATGLWAF